MTISAGTVTQHERWEQNPHTLHYNFFLTARTVKISILLLYNLCMRYRLGLFKSTQLVQPLLRFVISARLNFWSRVKIHVRLVLCVNLARDTTVSLDRMLNFLMKRNLLRKGILRKQKKIQIKWEK